MADNFRMVPKKATIEEINALVQRLPAEIAQRVAGPGLKAASNVVLKQAKVNLAPHTRTGRLKAALKSRSARINVKAEGPGYETRVKIPGGKAYISSEAEKTNVYWAHFMEKGTKFGKFRRSRTTRRKSRVARFGQQRTKAYLYIERASQSTFPAQRTAFRTGAARGLVNLERRARRGKLTKFERAAFERFIKSFD